MTVQECLDKHCFQIFERGRTGHKPNHSHKDEGNYWFWEDLLTEVKDKSEINDDKIWYTKFNKIKFGKAPRQYSGSSIMELEHE